MACSKVWQVVIRGDKNPPQQAQRPRLSYWLVERRCWERGSIVLPSYCKCNVEGSIT